MPRDGDPFERAHETEEAAHRALRDGLGESGVVATDLCTKEEIWEIRSGSRGAGDEWDASAPWLARRPTARAPI